MIWDSLWTLVRQFLVDPILSLPLPEVPFNMGEGSAFAEWIAYGNRFVDVSLLFKFLGAIAGIAIAIFAVRILMMIWSLIRG